MTDRIANPDALLRPGNRADRRRVARKVLQLLAQREERYPALVTDGRMTSAEAEIGLATMRALAAQWRWAVDATEPPLPGGNSFSPFGADVLALAAETRTIAERARQLAARTPDDTDAAETADLCEVIAWWQHVPCTTPRIVGQVMLERRMPEHPRPAELALAA